MSRRWGGLLPGLALAILTIGLDQAAKWWVLSLATQPRQAVELTGWLNLVLTWNHGVSFGLFAQGHPATPFILVGVALAVVAVLGRWLAQTESWLVTAALGLIIGGALGNVADRLVYGAVVDFIDFHLGDWHFPWAFNVADSAITVGVGLLIIDGLFGRAEMS
jgi:signal peptidase II